MEPVAAVLSRVRGVLEPIQSASSIDGQIYELHEILERNATLPVTLVGHSWGAWLSCLYAARYPIHVRSLILIGSGPFEEKYVSSIDDTRSQRLTVRERARAGMLMRLLSAPGTAKDSAILREFGELMSKADSYDPISPGSGLIEFQPEVFRAVMREAELLRRTGTIMEFLRSIQCPVTAIHGEYDPHPYRGVSEPLSRALPGARFILLRRCGHAPWNERGARNEFFEILERELADADRF
jgi:pimeloyl-ACP methyl ester carboxylesterase